MNEFNLKRLDSAAKTVAYCELPPSITATLGIANFAPQVALVKGKIVIIQSYNQLGSATTKGITLNLVGIRNSMMQNSYLLANAVSSYGASTTPPDNDLIQSCKLHIGTLENMSKQNCVNKCDSIQKLAAANAVAIAPFGASATAITDTATLVTLYMTGIETPGTALITRNNAKKQADIVLNETMATELELKLDTMANTLRFTNTEWWNGYRSAREIIDPGSFSTILKIKVLNKANDEPLINVKCYHDNELTFKKSTTLGFVTFKDITEGSHSFTLKHKKFEDLAIPSVMIAHGKKYEVVAKMKPIIGGNGGVVFPIIWQGDLSMGNISSFELLNIHADAHPNLTFIFENTSTSVLRFYAAAAAGDLPPASPVLDVLPNNAVPKTVDQMINELGFSNTNHHLNVFNVGPAPAHFKVIIEE